MGLNLPDDSGGYWKLKHLSNCSQYGGSIDTSFQNRCIVVSADSEVCLILLGTADTGWNAMRLQLFRHPEEKV